MTVPARPGEVAALADALRATGSVRVDGAQLWTLWTVAAPRLAGHPDQAAALAATLRELADHGVVELPVSAWDAATSPPLPRSVTVPAARRPARDRAWIRFPWRHELGWVASLPVLSDGRLRDLVAVNDWLARTGGGNVPVVPLRYRSVEVFGDEKCLEGMARTNLFGPGRLSLQLLACQRIPAPLPAVVTGTGPDILVVENSDTYWAAVAALGRGGNERVGAVAWGCGKAFPSQVAALGVDVAGRGPVTGRTWYWGDLDPAGLTIAVDAAAAAGTTPILPAVGLWAAMAARPVQEAGTVDWSRTPGDRWLGTRLWECLGPVRAAGGRVAQESVPAEAISDWAASVE